MNEHLQNSWNKYGEENFEFILLITDIDPEKLLVEEQSFLDKALVEKELCFNKTFIAGKIEMTPDTKLKMSLARQGKYFGENNNAYIKVSDDVFLALKSIWIESGKTIVTSYAKNNFNIGGTIISRLIKEFKTDEYAVLKRQENFTTNARNNRIKNTTLNMYGEQNPRYDHNSYTFLHKKTGEKFTGTNRQFLEKFKPVSNIRSVSKGKRKSAGGWILFNS